MLKKSILSLLLPFVANYEAIAYASSSATSRSLMGDHDSIGDPPLKILSELLTTSDFLPLQHPHIDHILDETDTMSSSSTNKRKLSSSTPPYNQCDEIVETVQPNEVLGVAQLYFTNMFDAQNAAFFMGVFGPLFKYGVQVRTVCASCMSVKADFEKLYPDLSDEALESYNSICSEDKYGYDIEHSGLVMIPLVADEENGGVVPLSGDLPVFVTARGARSNKYFVPSQQWIGSAPGGQSGVNILHTFIAAATKGMIGFAPDFIGHGLSDAYRGFLLRETYLTSSIPLWVKMASSIQAETNCETKVANAAFVRGYSEGGYSSVVVADGLNKALAITIPMVISGGGPNNSQASLKSIYKSFKAGLLDVFFYVAIMMGSSFSSTVPDVANYNTGQDLLSFKYNNPALNVIDWLDEPDIDARTYIVRLYTLAAQAGIPTNDIIDDLWNPVVTSFLQDAIDNNITEPCDPASNPNYQVGVIDKFCEAILENDSLGIIYNATYPVTICHALQDELASFENSVPADLQALPHVTVIPKNGTHADGANQCYVDDILFMAGLQFQTYQFFGGSSNCIRCSDSSLKFKLTWKDKLMNRNCTWVEKEETALKCTLDNVSEMCAETCGICKQSDSTSCVDSTARFKLTWNGRERFRDCAWVKSKATKMRCKVEGVAEACRETCDLCYH